MGGMAMNCMKCGRELDGDHAFCPKCRELMDLNPVKPEVVISLPNRQDFDQKKAVPRKREQTPEEQIHRLKRINIWLIISVCLMAMAITALTLLSADLLKQLDIQRFLGQNYSSVETIG